MHPHWLRRYNNKTTWMDASIRRRMQSIDPFPFFLSFKNEKKNQMIENGKKKKNVLYFSFWGEGPPLNFILFLFLILLLLLVLLFIILMKLSFHPEPDDSMTGPQESHHKLTGRQSVNSIRKRRRTHWANPQPIWQMPPDSAHRSEIRFLFSPPSSSSSSSSLSLHAHTDTHRDTHTQIYPSIISLMLRGPQLTLAASSIDPHRLIQPLHSLFMSPFYCFSASSSSARPLKLSSPPSTTPETDQRRRWCL